MTETLNLQSAALQSLTPHQLERANIILDYLLDPQSPLNYVQFRGFAGTGKTFTLSCIIQAYREVNPKAVVAMTAPTHKAVKQLRRNTPDSRNFDFGTIHSLLGLKERINFQTGHRTFEPDEFAKRQSRIDEANILVVDESSMLPKPLFNAIMQYQQGLGSKNDLRIIFVGDPKQLPPVKEEFSMAFLPHPLYVSESVVLTEPMRQASESNILSFATTIRDSEDTDVSYKDFLGEDVISVNDDYFTTYILPMFKEQYDLDNDSIKVLAYTNAAVKIMNQRIREYRLGELNPPKIVAGDYLIADDPIFDMTHPLKPIIIHNSEEMVVEDCIKTELALRWNVCKPLDEIRQELLLKAPGDDPVRKEEWVTTAIKRGFATTSTTMTHKFEVYKCDVAVQRLDDAGEEVTHKCRIFVIHENSEGYFKQVTDALEQLAHKAYDRKTAWKEFYNFQKHVAKVSPNYALTIHKSQGSTYNKCVLMMSTVDSLKKVVNGVDIKQFERNCLRYVGVSRAKETLFIYD